MIAEYIKKERLVQKKERLVQLDKALARAFSAITHISDTLLVEEVKDILECVFGKEAISACFGGRASRGIIIYFNIDIEKSTKYRLIWLSKEKAEELGYISLGQIFMDLLYDLAIRWYWIMSPHDNEYYLTKEDAEHLAQELREIMNERAKTEDKEYYYQPQELTYYA
jgi:hypothetical protein